MISLMKLLEIVLVVTLIRAIYKALKPPSPKKYQAAASRKRTSTSARRFESKDQDIADGDFEELR